MSEPTPSATSGLLPPAPPAPRPAQSLGVRRCRVTVLFTDLCGSTLEGRGMEAETLHELIEAVRGIWYEVAARHSGRVIRVQGDGALIVFGYPWVGEEDGLHAAWSALDIHAAVAALTPIHFPGRTQPLQMRSGIHAGTLVVSAGDAERGSLDLTGDVVNTAAKVQQSAPVGAVLATQSALGPHANALEVAPFDPSRSGPDGAELPALLRVLARSSVERRIDATAKRGLTPFIGRAEIIAPVLQALSHLHAAAPRCVVVQANPGMGKTRLLDEIAAMPVFVQRQVLRGSCESFAAAQVLQPFVQMLRSHAPTPATLGPHTSLLEPVLQLCQGQATLMMIDDWQWADDASRQLLDSLLQRTDGPQVLLASRPREDGGDWLAGAPHFSLNVFDAEQTQQAVRRWLPAADPFLTARIHEYAGGVPLFIEELCHSSAALTLLDGGLPRGTPMQTWLGSLVASRFARLPAEQAAVVRAAAVVGTVVPNALLDAVCEPAPSAPILQALAEADFLYPSGRPGELRFKHGITRDAVYESISLAERRALHQRVLAALQGPGGVVAGASAAAPQRGPVPGAFNAQAPNWADGSAPAAGAPAQEPLEALAYHSQGAGQWERAAYFAEGAGDRAGRAFAMDRARVQYHAVLAALDRLPTLTAAHTRTWCSVAQKLGMACIFDVLAMPDALPLFDRSVSLARALGDDAVTARSLYWQAYIAYGTGQLRVAARVCREALALARACGDSRLAAQVQATLGQVLAGTGEYDESLGLMERALDTMRQVPNASGSSHRSEPAAASRPAEPGARSSGVARPGVAVGLAFTLACKASVLADRGDFSGAHGSLDEAMLLVGDSPHPVANSVRNWVVMVLLWQGRWADAQRVADESVRLAENSHALLPLAIGRAAGGYARWMATGAPAALDAIAQAALWMEQRRCRFFTTIFHGWLVAGRCEQGQMEVARQHAARLFMRARADETLGQAMGCRALALATAKQGRPERAAYYLQRAEATALQRSSRREAALNTLCRAHLLRSGGVSLADPLAQPAAAALQASSELAAQACAEFQAMGMLWHRDHAARLVSLVARAAPRRGSM
jgi:class 3 adenylate cyclase/tetratricopeptide (TPR) repeat protein